MTAHSYSGVEEGDGAADSMGIDDHNDSDEDEYLTGPPRSGGHHSLPPSATISPQDVAMGRMAARRRRKKLVALGIALVACVVVFAGYSYTRSNSTPVATSDSDAAAAGGSPNVEGVESPPSQDEGEPAPETNQAGAGSYGDDEFAGGDDMGPYDDMDEEQMYDDVAEEPMYDDMEMDDMTDEAPIYDDAFEDEAIYDDIVEGAEGEGGEGEEEEIYGYDDQYADVEDEASGEGPAEDEEGEEEEEIYGYDDQYADMENEASPAEPEPNEPAEAYEPAEPQGDQEGGESQDQGSEEGEGEGEGEDQGGEGEGEGEGDEFIDQGQYEEFEEEEEEALGASIPTILDENLVDVDLEEVPTDTPMLWVLSETGAEDIFGLCLGLTQASGFFFEDEDEEDMSRLEVVEEDEMNFLNVDTFTVEGLDRAKELNMAKSGLADVVVTPFLYPGSDLFDKDHRGQLMAIFRHPIEQLTRNYLDYVEDLEMEFEEQGKEITDEDIMTIEDYVMSDETVDNFVVRSLTDNWEGDLTEDDLDLAKDIVERKILVGLAERMEETMERFEAYFRWQLKDIDAVDCQKEILEEDTTIDAEYAEDYVEQGSDTWRILADMHALDLDLYEFVTVVWEEQVEFFR